MANRFRRVTVVLPNTPFQAAEVMRGVAAYARGQRDWRLLMLSELASTQQFVRAVSTSQGLLLTNIAWAEVAPLPKATVLMRGSGKEPFPYGVNNDDRLVGKAAAEHLIERGFRRLGYYGLRLPFSRQREAGFVEAVEAAGCRCVVAHPVGRPQQRYGWEAAIRGDTMSRWLRTLVPPIGVFAASDQLAAGLLLELEALGLRVPEDVAVVGVDNNELRCEYSPPPLSSVDPDLERVGLESARLVDRLMRGEAVPAAERHVLVPPIGVVPRQSTNVVAVGDDAVAEAVRLIRRNLEDPPSVDELAAAVKLSRSTLERRFRRQLGRMPGDEIRRARLQHARALLVETDRPLASIAAATGFAYLSHFSKAFRRAYGEAPRRYRQKHGGS